MFTLNLPIRSQIGTLTQLLTLTTTQKFPPQIVSRPKCWLATGGPKIKGNIKWESNMFMCYIEAIDTVRPVIKVMWQFFLQIAFMCALKKQRQTNTSVKLAACVPEKNDFVKILKSKLFRIILEDRIRVFIYIYLPDWLLFNAN